MQERETDVWPEGRSFSIPNIKTDRLSHTLSRYLSYTHWHSIEEIEVKTTPKSKRQWATRWPDATRSLVVYNSLPRGGNKYNRRTFGHERSTGKSKKNWSGFEHATVYLSNERVNAWAIETKQRKKAAIILAHLKRPAIKEFLMPFIG